MLILSRRPGESVTLGDDIVVTVVSVNGNQVRLGINAPREVRVLRDEIYKAIREENQAAAKAHEQILILCSSTFCWLRFSTLNFSWLVVCIHLPEREEVRRDQGQ